MNNKVTQNGPGRAVAKFGLLTLALVALTANLQAAVGKDMSKVPGILPPNQQGIYMQLQADWWAWILGTPFEDPATFPLLTGDGNLAMKADGDVILLAGTYFGMEVKRQCTIPAKKGLFFPIANYVYLHNLKEDPPVKEQRAICKQFVDAVINFSCEIDGQPVGNLQAYRFQSPVFKVQLPENNIFGIEAGKFPCVDEGYYLLLAPLPVGVHTIHFHAEVPADWGWGPLDVTYEITVE